VEVPAMFLAVMVTVWPVAGVGTAVHDRRPLADLMNMPVGADNRLHKMGVVPTAAVALAYKKNNKWPAD
jgi:hypothetical protein